MMMLVTYDVDTTDSGGAKRLRQVAKVCENYGVRVQNSVFELIVDPAQVVMVKAQLTGIIDKELDSVRFYRIGSTYANKIEEIGRKQRFEQDKPIIL